jgi:ABC-type bacteriocin/lantibiotic exporter with double-glycine peptidase domain
VSKVDKRGIYLCIKNKEVIMIAVVFVVLFSLFMMGIEDGDLTLIALGGIPLLLGIVGGLLQFYANRKLEQMQKENPKIKEICDEIDRIKRR